MEDSRFTYYNDGPDLVFKEYGRNVHKMVTHLLETEDRDTRTDMAYALIDLMRRLNPAPIEDTEEEYRKLWDHLYIMADYELDRDAPYPAPLKPEEVEERKPMSYPDSKARFKHYGKNVELLVKQTVKTEDDNARENNIIYLGRLMKNLYGTWNKDNVEDSVIIDQLDALSKGELKIDSGKISAENLFDSPVKEWKNLPGSAGTGQRATFLRRTNTIDKKRKK
ncbi:MAG: DUF4290 domain-containing protein [Bacteroidota bacterium]